MRKLLLASAAMMAAGVGFAHAQGNGTWQTNAQAADIRPPFNLLGSDFRVPPLGQPDPILNSIPGNLAVHLNGKIRAWVIGFDEPGFTSVAPVTGAAAGSTQTVYGGKLASVSMQDYIRFNFGVDGTAANGLRYGADAQIRHDGLGGAVTNTGSDSGSGAGGTSAVSSSGAVNRKNRGALYVVETFGYLAGDQVGTFRFGTAYSPALNYTTGTLETVDNGGFNGDQAAAFTFGNIAWPFADGSATDYNRTSVQYFSPQIAGFEIGAMWAPNQADVNGNQGCTAATGAASAGCSALVSEPNGVTTDLTRQTEYFQLAGRYRGLFNGFGVNLYGSYHVAGAMGYEGTRNVSLTSGNNNYQGLSVGEVGASFTYAGIMVGAAAVFGDMNGSYNTLQKGADTALGIAGGIDYQTGPLNIGVQYLYYKSAGDVGADLNGKAAAGGTTSAGTPTGIGSDRVEQGINLGLAYALAPGLNAYGTYEWVERKQTGYNFVSGADSFSSTTEYNGSNGYLSNNKITAQLFGVGIGYTW